MCDHRHVCLPQRRILEALRRPRWLQQALLLVPDERDKAWLAHKLATSPAPSWAGNATSQRTTRAKVSTDRSLAQTHLRRDDSRSARSWHCPRKLPRRQRAPLLLVNTYVTYGVAIGAKDFTTLLPPSAQTWCGFAISPSFALSSCTNR